MYMYLFFFSEFQRKTIFLLTVIRDFSPKQIVQSSLHRKQPASDFPLNAVQDLQFFNAQKNVQDIETISNRGTMKHILHIKQYLVTKTI